MVRPRLSPEVRRRPSPPPREPGPIPRPEPPREPLPLFEPKLPIRRAAFPRPPAEEEEPREREFIGEFLPEYLSAREAKEIFGVDLEEGWRLRVLRGRDRIEVGPVSPGGWEITRGGNFISPEGRWYTEQELEVAIETGEVTYTDLGVPAPMPEIRITRDIEEAAFLRQVEEQRGIEDLLLEIIPEVPVEYASAVEWASDEENLDDLFLSIQNAGQTPATEALLARLGATEEQVEAFFPETKKWWTVDYWLDNFFKPYGGTDLKGKAAASFMAGIGDMAISAGGAARWLGYEDMGSVLSNIGTPLQRVAPPNTMGEFEWADMLDPEFYATKVVRAIPFALSLMPAGVGGFYGGTALAAAMGLGTIWRVIIGGITGAALSRPAESALEAGSSYDDAIARGKTEAEAKEEATEVFRNNMLLVGADAWEIAIALAPTPKWVPTALVRQGLVRTAVVAGKVMIVGLSEGGEEIYQDMVQRHARGEEWQLDPVAKEVFAIGFTMGAGMGLGGDVISGVVNKSQENMTSAQKSEFAKIISGFEAQGFTEEQSQAKALDEFLQDPITENIINDAIVEEGREAEVERVAPEEVVPEVAPPVVKEVKVPEIEAVPERAVYKEGGVPVSPDEPMSPEIAENIPIVKDIGVKERWVRPTRKVFERMGLYEEYKGIQTAEVELGEAKKAFARKLKEVAKTVDTKRRHLVFRELENPGSQVGLTFDEKRAVTFFRENFNKWADILNLPQEKRLKNYITHIFEADIAEELKAKHPLDPAIARALEYKAPKTIFNPFLQKRLGATTGLVEDPFAAASAYESRQLKVLYYEPWLQKIATIANDKSTPQIMRDYLKDYARRMTGQPSKLDIAINNTLTEFAEAIGKLPGGEAFAGLLTRGNPSGMAAYNFTSLIYTLWLGFKPTSAIRNLSQHTLIIGETGPIHFANGIALRFTKEGKAALGDSLVLRSRKAAFVPGIDDSFTAKWTDKFREAALWMFRLADKQNVSDAFLAGYSEAKSLIPEADRQLWIDRGDEVAADTQYLYTQMNSMAISQSSMGRVFSILTTWAQNWMELMTKWVSKRPSSVYLQYEKETGKKLPKKNWSQTYKAITMYMAIIALGYMIKEHDRLKAWEYTGITSIRYLADVAGGDFPGLQVPKAVANMVAGFLTDDERMLKTGWSQFWRTVTPGVVRQLQDVALGEKDWLTLFFYLEGRDFYIKQLKNKWEKGWKDYEALETAKERDGYRENNPTIEAQMFITSKFTTLSTEAARREVLRIIEENNLDVELIDGYDKVFGVDTDEKFAGFRKNLGQVELTEEGEQKLKENGELDYYTTSNFASDVNALEKTVGRYKIEKDGNPLAVEYLRAKDLFVQYDNITTDEGRLLYRQQFPDVEAQLYLWGKIGSFKNPKSAEILLGLMEKYNIPPESVPAFLEDPSKYDELFTLKHELNVKSFDLDTLYENYGNPEAEGIYIEDEEERKKARALLKEENPNWVADIRRIEAIDHDATPEIIEKWAERGKAIDEFGAGSSEAKVWLLDNPEVHTWALDNDLLKDRGLDWNEDLLRVNVALNQEVEGSAEYQELLLKKKAYSADIPDEQIDNYLTYYKLPDAGYRRERFLMEHPDFARAIDVEIPERVPSEQYDILLEKEDRTPEDERRMDAYKIYFPDDMIDTYVDWYITPRKDYEDDWFLMENIEFYNTMIERGIFTERRDFRKVPTRKVWGYYQIYLGLPLGQVRLDYRFQYPELDEWLVMAKGLTPVEDRGSPEADISAWEELSKKIAEIKKRLGEL